jgi:hypothetical protein
VALKACTVVIQDIDEIAHAIDVTAESLYEAIGPTPSLRCAVTNGSARSGKD